MVPSNEILMTILQVHYVASETEALPLVAAVRALGIFRERARRVVLVEPLPGVGALLHLLHLRHNIH